MGLSFESPIRRAYFLHSPFIMSFFARKIPQLLSKKWTAKQKIHAPGVLLGALFPLSAALFAWSSQALAAPPVGAPQCSMSNELYDLTQVTQMPSCTLQITLRPESQVPNSAPTRGLVLTSDGGLLVVATIDPVIPEGSPVPSLSMVMGARAYYFFPRERELDWMPPTEDSLLRVYLTNSEILRIHSQSGQVDSYSGASVSASSEISLKNKGGIEFQAPPRRGLRMDCGWRQGASPIEKTTASCTITDRMGKTCTLKNTNLFTYKYAGGSLVDVKLKHSTDQELAEFLKTACPALDPKWTEPLPLEATGPCPNPEEALRLKWMEELGQQIEPRLTPARVPL